MSQNKSILNYLKAGNTLTGLDALKLFGTMKLASRLSEIKKEFADADFEIKDRIIETFSGKHIKEYWLEKKIIPQPFEKNNQYAFL